MKMRTSWVGGIGLGLCVSVFSACFESGPLQQRWDEDAPVGLDTAADSQDPEDSTPPEIDTTEDSSEPLEDVEPPRDTQAEVDAGPVVSCTNLEHCVHLNQACQAPYICKSYECTPQPDWQPCPSSGDACLEATCNPTTGACETRNLCSCEPHLTLECGQATSWNPTEIGSRPPLENAVCGGVTAAPDGWPVLVKLNGAGPSLVQVDGASSIHLLQAGLCDAPSSCLAGGVTSLSYTFQNSQATLLSVIERNEFQAVTLSLACNLQAEVQCNNGLDEDGDGRTDCEDIDCNGRDGCPSFPTSETQCGNGVDDDRDGQTDCEDSDCASQNVCRQACSSEGTPLLCFASGTTHSSNGGSSIMSRYSCHNTPMHGKELIYNFSGGASGRRMTFSFRADQVPGMRMHFIRPQEGQCMASACEGSIAAGQEQTLYIPAQEKLYVVFDAPSGGGEVTLTATCPDG